MITLAFALGFVMGGIVGVAAALVAMMAGVRRILMGVDQ